MLLACTRPHSSRKACIACTWYVKSPDLLSVTTAIAMPVSTSIPVRIGVVRISPSVLKSQKSNCNTGVVLVCFCCLCASALPLLCTHSGHQLLKGRCVRLCSALSCGVGCSGLLMPFAGIACCCSSSSMIGVVFVLVCCVFLKVCGSCPRYVQCCFGLGCPIVIDSVLPVAVCWRDEGGSFCCELGDVWTVMCLLWNVQVSSRLLMYSFPQVSFFDPVVSCCVWCILWFW